MSSKQHNKLELRWHDKDKWENPEPRILIEKKVYKNSKKGLEDNILIYGDNLLGLKALEHEYTGKIKCIYIDPPYNTKSCFSHYNDNMEHSLWLNMMKERLIIMHNLLKEDGSIWISIDDDECHYLKVLCDEIFGRRNFVSNVIWQKKSSSQPNCRWISDIHDHILVYAKNKLNWKPNLINFSEEKKQSKFKNPDKDPRGPWAESPFTISLTGGQRGAQFAKTGYSPNIYIITLPSGKKILPPKGRCWARNTEKFKELVKEKRIWFGKNNDCQPKLKKFPNEIQGGIVSASIFFQNEVGNNSEAKKEVIIFNPQDIFSTPKPERLIQRILHLATNPGDFVLDSFAGSGTTGAVAHKMGRRWIMIEMEKTCHTHIIPRLQKVIDGIDQGGISKNVNWQGGGGFRYYEMAPSLLEKNRLGRWTVNKKYHSAMLSEAVCLHAGYKYDPKKDPYWMHGYSTENDFIYVTSQILTRTELIRLSYEVGEGRSLMVYCGAFKTDDHEFDNLYLRKIPKAILNKCTWGKDDYALKVALKTEAKTANREKNINNAFSEERSNVAIVAKGR